MKLNFMNGNEVHTFLVNGGVLYNTLNSTCAYSHNTYGTVVNVLHLTYESALKIARQAEEKHCRWPEVILADGQMLTENKLRTWLDWAAYDTHWIAAEDLLAFDEEQYEGKVLQYKINMSRLLEGIAELDKKYPDSVKQTSPVYAPGRTAEDIAKALPWEIAEAACKRVLAHAISEVIQKLAGTELLNISAKQANKLAYKVIEQNKNALIHNGESLIALILSEKENNCGN